MLIKYNFGSWWGHTRPKSWNYKAKEYVSELTKGNNYALIYQI